MRIVLVVAFIIFLEYVRVMARFETTSEVIDAFGGNIPMGLLTNTDPKTVSAWRRIGRFPWRTQVIINKALRARRHSAPVELWGMTGLSRPKNGADNGRCVNEA